MDKKHIFGPIPSRRLGISLGIDLVPHKTCSLDCVYCEAGETDKLTLERREYVPIDEVIAELNAFLSSAPKLDFLTFSGAGEPTLNSGIGKVLRFIREQYPQYKTCLLTNGTLLGNESLASEILDFDLVIPSLDAATDEQYRIINRPCHGLTLDDLVNGMSYFRSRFTGGYWLELFVVPGVNDSDDSIAAFLELIIRINPDKVQLNTLDRPGCVDWIKAAGEETLMRFIRAFESHIPVEAVGRFRYSSYEAVERPFSETEQRIVDMVSRRPATIEDICLALAVSPEHAETMLSELEKLNKLVCVQSRRGRFYRLP